MTEEMAERLRQLRDKQNYKQEGMARAAGVSQRTWSTWEVDPPSQFEALRKLCEHFHVSADYLLGLTNDPRPADERGAGWDEVVVQIAQDVMYLPPDRRINVQMAVGAIVEREKAVRRAEQAQRMAELYREALDASYAFMAPSVDEENLKAFRQEQLSRLAAAALDGVIEPAPDK